MREGRCEGSLRCLVRGKAGRVSLLYCPEVVSKEGRKAIVSFPSCPLSASVPSPSPLSLLTCSLVSFAFLPSYFTPCSSFPFPFFSLPCLSFPPFTFSISLTLLYSLLSLSSILHQCLLSPFISFHAFSVPSLSFSSLYFPFPVYPFLPSHPQFPFRDFYFSFLNFLSLLSLSLFSLLFDSFFFSLSLLCLISVLFPVP